MNGGRSTQRKKRRLRALEGNEAAASWAHLVCAREGGPRAGHNPVCQRELVSDHAQAAVGVRGIPVVRRAITTVGEKPWEGI